MSKSIRLPNAVVVGAPRSGTTSLFFYLKQHPDIFLPVRKELHYFSYDLLKENANGPGDQGALASLCATREEYETHYASVGAAKVIGEVSPSYLYFSEASERIHSELSEVKIIALLRNPVDKAFSQYMHLVRENRETLSFYEALMAETHRWKLGWSDIWRYAESSLYSERIKKYISVFGANNTKIILFDDLASAPDTVMSDLFEFLEVDTSFRPDTSKVYLRSGRPRSKLAAEFFAKPNPLKTVARKLIPERIRVPIRLALLDANIGDKGEIDDTSKAYLQSYFYDDIVELEKVVGRKTGWIGTGTSIRAPD
jgi:hypothetical protein